MSPKCRQINPSVENSAQIKCSFIILRIRIFSRFLCQSTDNFSNFVWVCKTKIWALNKVKTQLWLWTFYKKMWKIADKNLAQYIDMDYAQNSSKGKFSTWYCLFKSQCSIIWNLKQFHQIWTKLLFLRYFGPCQFRKWPNMHEFALELPKNAV